METPTNNLTVKELAQQSIYGAKMTFTLPSGFYVTIREQNGADEDILSNKSTSQDLTNISMFLSNIIIDTDLPMAKSGKLDVDGAKQLLLRDKYCILVNSRIHSYGEDVKLIYHWDEKYGGETHYTENLSRYIWDYGDKNKPFPYKGTEGYDKERIEPYPVNAYGKQEYTLKSGKVIRFNFLDGLSEIKLLKLPIDQQTRNSEIKARNLELKFEDEFIKVDSFEFFRRDEMAELHKFFNTIDTSFAGLTEIVNPLNTELVDYMSVLQSNDFFYPGEI